MKHSRLEIPSGHHGQSLPWHQPSWQPDTNKPFLDSDFPPDIYLPDCEPQWESGNFQQITKVLNVLQLAGNCRAPLIVLSVLHQALQNKKFKKMKEKWIIRYLPHRNKKSLNSTNVWPIDIRKYQSTWYLKSERGIWVDVAKIMADMILTGTFIITRLQLFVKLQGFQ